MGCLAVATVDHWLLGVACQNQAGRAFLFYPEMSLQHLLLPLAQLAKETLCFYGADDGGKFEAEAAT